MEAVGLKSVYISRADHIAARILDGETMVMSAAGSDPCVLNETATIIWQAADGITPLSEIVASKVCAEFDVAPEVAMEDAGKLVMDLAGRGLLLISDQPAAEKSEPRP